MDFQFEQNLPHQQLAIDKILQVVNSIHSEPSLDFASNKIFYPKDEEIKKTVCALQKDFEKKSKGFTPAETAVGTAEHPCIYIDVKMETGTGKTYVYTKTIYELHKQHGISKFILVVPGLAIKAGTANFLKSPDVKKHFEQDCGYGTEIRLFEGTGQKSNNKRKMFPSAVSGFYQNPGQSDKYISVLLLNSSLLTNSNYTKDDFDYGIDNYYCPLDALKATRPVVIIDEPHRFSSETKVIDAIMNRLCPQMLIRFGATYPEYETGKGKSKQTVKDYKNLVYNLDAYDSFQQNLIKGIAKEHLPQSKDVENIKIRVDSIDKNAKNVKFTWKDAPNKSKQKTLTVGELLSDIHDDFGNLRIDSFESKNSVLLSNGLVLKEGSFITPDMYATPYQRSMIKLAINRHLETERQNFNREDKIKTLALFFIDDIAAYREEKGYIKRTFEEVLKSETKKFIEKLDDSEIKYKTYLENSLKDIEHSHGGYFAEDNSSSDDEITKQVNEILNDKKALLSFDNPRRFIFSKWTLKEGWDNPNVFTIAKLRSSGSEISKLQEVGRGLRLPVNESGKRITDEEFTLNYIVDYTEEDFAQKLVDEINGERSELMFITEEQFQKYADEHKMDIDELKLLLLTKKFIGFRKDDMPGYPINEDKTEEFEAEYPDLFKQSATKKKIVDRNKNQDKKQIGVRSKNYSALKNLWLKMNGHYLLTFEDDLNKDLSKVLPTLIKQELFAKTILASSRQELTTENGVASLKDSSSQSYETERPLPYGKFLQRIQTKESVPVTEMHKVICDFVRNGGKPQFNEKSLSNICKAIHEWKISTFKGRFSYQNIERTQIKETSLNDSKGNAKKFIKQGLIGTLTDKSNVPEKYLYDAITFDSPLEKDDILNEVDGVDVFGKIPRKTIQIPTILGETYSPDFMYIVKRNSKDELNLIVECKDVNDADKDLRGGEKLKIESAKKFFESLSSAGVKVHFEKQIKTQNLKELIEKL